MSDHNFKRLIWTPDLQPDKDKFHCKKCDSMVIYPKHLSEYEVNHLIAKAKKGSFPCIDVEAEDKKLGL